VQLLFFRFDDQSKKSLATCLRSLAFQTAQQLPEFQRALNGLSDTGLKLEKFDARTIWKVLGEFCTYLADIRSPEL